MARKAAKAQEPMKDVVTMIKVTNNNAVPVIEMHNGISYMFEPGTPVTIPADVAAHIFGWIDGQDRSVSRMYMRSRWGMGDIRKQAEYEAFLDAIVIEPVRARMVEVPKDWTPEEIDDAIAAAAAPVPELPIA